MSLYVKEMEFMMYLYTLTYKIQNAGTSVILVRSSTDINGCCVWLLAGLK
jgi:hypothetical protein